MKKVHYFIIIFFISTTNLVCMEEDGGKKRDDMQKNRERNWFLRNSDEEVTSAKKIRKLTLHQRRVLAIKTPRIPLSPCYPFTKQVDINAMTKAGLKSVSFFTSKEYNTIKQSVRDKIDLEDISQEDLKKNIIPELFILWKNTRDENTPEICARFYTAVLKINKKKNIYLILAGSLTKLSSKKTQANHGRLLASIRNSADSSGCKIIYNLTVCEATRSWWEYRGYKAGKVKYLN